MRWYSAYCFEVTVQQTLILLLLFKDSSHITSFPGNSLYGLNVIGQQDHEVEQLVLRLQ